MAITKKREFKTNGNTSNRKQEKQLQNEQRRVTNRLRAQKEAFQSATSGAPLEESLKILIRTAVEEGEGGFLHCG